MNPETRKNAKEWIDNWQDLRSAGLRRRGERYAESDERNLAQDSNLRALYEESDDE